MGGIGKTTLAEAVYNEVFTTFESCYFLQNVREKIEKQGKEFARNEVLSVLLKDKEIHINTPSIGYPYRERLNNLRVIVVLDDVYDSEQVDRMGVKHFGDGSKIILTSRNRQVLMNGEVNKIHLSYKFVRYAQGSPLALKILGGKLLYSKSREEWESEVDRLTRYVEPKISDILKSSFDGLDKLEKNIFLDIACFSKGDSKEDVEEILNCTYINLYVSPFSWEWISKPPVNGVGIASLPNELRYVAWECYPFKSLSPNFNPKNLVVLKLTRSDIEQLWNEDDFQPPVDKDNDTTKSYDNARKTTYMSQEIVVTIRMVKAPVPFPTHNL
ncbi:disease resistance protein RUN1-like [Hibiscus syriacus]|uniref:disease resistance protein RUN1-like n=1 Tax=Hibiscus syriacus TaxID=106335 RepID=UPI00192379AD|nr:disease resistance protein RUN1-like [Hibiscus syriacus]